MILAVFALFTMIFGMFRNGLTDNADGTEGPGVFIGMLEGVSIFGAILILVFFTALNDYSKDLQMVKLSSLSRDEDMPVIRGKQSAVQTVNIWNLVVGDVIKLNPGDRIPADCLYLDGNNVTVDESSSKNNTNVDGMVDGQIKHVSKN